MSAQKDKRHGAKTGKNYISLFSLQLAIKSILEKVKERLLLLTYQLFVLQAVSILLLDLD